MEISVELEGIKVVPIECQEMEPGPSCVYGLYLLFSTAAYPGTQR